MNDHNKDWQSHVLALHNTGMKGREISRTLEIPKSTVSDLIRKYSKPYVNSKEGNTHLVIFDTQVRPGISLEYLRWIGEYIVRKRPDTIVMIGDHADMPSLSSYDKGKRSAEGKRVQEDIEVAILGMQTLWKPLFDLQAKQKTSGEKVYDPYRIITLGNHEDRITRHVDANPELHGFLSLKDLQYEEMGLEVAAFLTPVKIDGISYCHYFPNVMSGKALTGTAQNMLKTIGESFTMGHRQTLDITTRTLQASGQRQWGVICGASYVHEEDYKGVQGNNHWRGIMVKHNVKNGSYDPLLISMDWLEKEYGEA